MSAQLNPRSQRGLVAVLGPTNTGKTHLAIERMLGYKSGLIGLPLRLLAREVYKKIADRIGADQVSLITGEERIDPPTSRYQVCTVEAMSETSDVEFVAIDEVQLAINPERGHIFTDRILNLRGSRETMLLGASTIEDVLRDLFSGIEIVSRPRMSQLSYAGSKKITRLPARTAIVAFSADEVYAIAELVRRQRGGAAVVMGSLSPRTRNAQVELYQSGQVDFLVATDAIGMGLNLDVRHVAFAQQAKFDGFQHRRLSAAELAQIAGRAGRHTNDGTFGVTGNVQPFEDELIQALETHQFKPIKGVMWRNSSLDFSSLRDLEASLEIPSDNPLLTRAPAASDLRALDYLAKDRDIRDQCEGEQKSSNLRLLWDVCRIPDYRNISPTAHGEILARVFMDIARGGHINADWFAYQTEQTERFDGDIDALSNRLSHIRTWTYLSNRDGWLDNSKFWQEKTRAIEDKLSDALHEALTKRFIDRRTSLLMKRLRENAMLEATISDEGAVVVEGHNVGNLSGFRFSHDASVTGPDAKTVVSAAMKALVQEIEKRSARVAACPNSDIVLTDDGHLRWLGQVVARVVANEKSTLSPALMVLADEQLTGTALAKVKNRLERWLANYIENLLRPLVELSRDETITGIARGLAFQLSENLGHLDRRLIADEVKQLDQDARATLRKHGVRFGAFHLFIPQLLKPAPTALICLLWAIRHDKLAAPGLVEIPQISATGRTSIAVDDLFTPEIYQLCGFRVLGKKAVRIDILERLADLIRPALAWSSTSPGEKPDGAFDGKQFFVTPAMLSILGATYDDMEHVLAELGYRSQKHLESEIFPAADPESAQEDSANQVMDKDKDQDKNKDIAPSVKPADKPIDMPTDKSADQPLAASSEAPSSEGSNGVALAKDTDAAEETGAPNPPEEKEPEKYVLLWRRDFKPKRSPRRQSGPRAGQQGNKGQQNRNSINKPVKKPVKGKPRHANASRKVDPDSPFAKLAALKETLKNK